MKNIIFRLPVDFYGGILSLLCAFHCAALPLLLSFSSLASLQFLANPWVEYFVLALGLALATLSLWPAYKVTHQKKLALVLMASGFIFIALGHFHIEDLNEILFSAFGAVFIAAAHIYNWTLVVKTRNAVPPQRGKM